MMGLLAETLTFIRSPPNPAPLSRTRDLEKTLDQLPGMAVRVRACRRLTTNWPV
jgi:hypothetical protein